LPADITSKIESFEKGTDEYIEKPFHPEVLKARIVGILNRRIKLVEHYRREFLQDPGVFINQHFGENFLNRVIECIRTDLSNQDFGVSMLSEKMHMSRVQLYRKISSTTGFSPVEFIRNIRIKAAAELFSKTELNVTQVMLEVGYGSPSYFTESFRRVFGCNPSEYRSSHIESPASVYGRPKGK
jgi:AraC-like DNA-binding protein